MLKVIHKECGWSKEFEFLCPKCNQPFCEEDSQQVQGGALVGHIANSQAISELNKKVQILSDEIEKLTKRIDNCKYCKKGITDAQVEEINGP